MKQFCEKCVTNMDGAELHKRIIDIFESYQIENPVCDGCGENADTLYILSDGKNGGA